MGKCPHTHSSSPKLSGQPRASLGHRIYPTLMRTKLSNLITLRWNFIHIKIGLEASTDTRMVEAAAIKAAAIYLENVKKTSVMSLEMSTVTKCFLIETKNREINTVGVCLDL